MDGFKKLIKNYALQDFLIYLSCESTKPFHPNEKSPTITEVHIEQLKKGKNQSDIFIEAWDLVDIAYYAIKYSNDYRSSSICSREEFLEVVKYYTDESALLESQQAFLQGNTDYRFKIYLYGFFGEQLIFQSRELVREQYNREYHILTEISKKYRDQINIEEIVKLETGLLSQDIKHVLYFLVNCSISHGPNLCDRKMKFGRHILTKDNVMKVIEFYSVTYPEIRNSPFERQILYTKPIVKTDKNNYISINIYLLYFLLSNSTYWIVRNFFCKKNSREFTTLFGKMFEDYFEELLFQYVEPGNYEHIHTSIKEKRADWYIKLNSFELVVEQKSALASIDAKQQTSDVTKSIEYVKSNWIYALEQLSNTEKLYPESRIIKIILVYEDYYQSEMLDDVFTMPENKTSDDHWFWVMTIRDFEVLLYLFKHQYATFETLMNRRIERECIKSGKGRDFRTMFEHAGIHDNPHFNATPDHFTMMASQVVDECREIY